MRFFVFDARPLADYKAGSRPIRFFVFDARPLAANIGIGMGITGTDVTKGTSDMVLADDNFATIVNAVEEGRKIYDNVLKVLQFQLSTNLSEVIIMFIASILHFTILSPVHLLWINIVTDSLPGLALGMEKAEGDIMRRRPRPTTDGIFSNGAGADMVWQGIYLAIIEIAAYIIGYWLEPVGGATRSLAGFFSGTECVNAMAMAFLTVNFAEMMCAINMRSRQASIFSADMMKKNELVACRCILCNNRNDSRRHLYSGSLHRIRN